MLQSKVCTHETGVVVCKIYICYQCCLRYISGKYYRN